jgi:3D (Asp-Asp-Asp) domain-containing protein
MTRPATVQDAIRTVAAPRSVPIGTVVEIQGVGRRVVADRTARRYNGRWDVYVSTHAQARRFGLRRATVTVLGRQAQRTRRNV